MNPDILGLLKRARAELPDRLVNVADYGAGTGESDVGAIQAAMDDAARYSAVQDAIDEAIALLERAEIVEGSGSTDPPDFIDCEPLEVPELRMRPATMIVWPEEDA